jgi:hypothetical protein
MKYIIRAPEELVRLREECCVLRNLLRDIAENEASLDGISAPMREEERVRLISDRIIRRRELCAEINAVVRPVSYFGIRPR